MTPLQHGKLEQACPCGRWEAAGPYCTKCFRQMGPDDWYPNNTTARREAVLGQRAARVTQKDSPPTKRGRGRPRRVSVPDTLGLVV